MSILTLLGETYSKIKSSLYFLTLHGKKYSKINYGYTKLETEDAQLGPQLALGLALDVVTTNTVTSQKQKNKASIKCFRGKKRSEGPCTVLYVLNFLGEPNGKTRKYSYFLTLQGENHSKISKKGTFTRLAR